jgi:cytochrome c oxidase cbb3-type subunit 3
MFCLPTKKKWKRIAKFRSMTDKKIYMLTTISYFKKQKVFMQKLLLLLLASLAANIIWAQDAGKEAAPVAKEVFYDSTVAYVLVTVIGLLAVVIFMLGNVFILAIKNKIDQEKQQGASKAAVLTGLFFILSAGSLFAQSTNLPAGTKTVVSETIIQMLAFVVVLEMIIIVYFANGIRSFLKKEAIQTAVAAGAAPVVKKEKIAWFDRLYNRNTNEDIARLDLGHDYDGIKELDNEVPVWWRWGFAISLVFGIVYMYSYHIAETKPLQQAELAMEMEQAAIQQAAYLEKSANNVDENTVKMLGADDIAAGKELYIKPGACATCHAENGSAIVNGAPGIGPNLTDDYWLHKGDIKAIFYSIKYGWPEKGMKAWKEDYSPLQMAQIASYVKSLQGTNPQPAKEKQGELFVETSAASAVADSTTAPAMK